MLEVHIRSSSSDVLIYSINIAGGVRLTIVGCIFVLSYATTAPGDSTTF